EDRGVTSASHLAIVADDRQHAHPWNVARQVAEDLIALRRVERHFRVDTRRNAQQSTRRIDHLALCGHAAAGEIDDLAASNCSAFDAGSFQPAYTFDHQGSDRQQRDDDQPGADAENCAASWAASPSARPWETLLDRQAFVRSPAPEHEI